MSSVVDICNLALSHIGDTANISSLTETSVQAQLCSRFYDMARKSTLELNPWSFATTRQKLAPLASNPTQMGSDGAATWQYAYGLPSAVLNAIAVISAEALDDYEMMFGPCAFPPYPQGYVPVLGSPLYMPQPFAIELSSNGSQQVVLTNVPDAVLRFTIDVVDTTKFDALFIMALSHFLASMLAGPIMKGAEGAAESKNQLALFKTFEGMAEGNDANQRKVNLEPAVAWIRGR